MNNFKKKNEFIILADVPPIPSEDRLIKYKEAGFNYYNLTEDYVVRDKENGGITDEYFKAIEDSHKLGLKVILRTMRSNSPDYYDTVTDEFKGKADAFYFCDEPSFTPVSWYGSGPLPKLKKFVDWYNEHGGDAFFHINLLQSYGMWIVHGRQNTPNYEDYLDTYIETILKNVKGEKSLSTDHYPIAFDTEGNNCIKESAILDYYLIADRSKKLRAEGHDVRSGFCIQLTSDKGLFIREMECPADITFQVNFAMAFGAKLLEYYLYVGRNTGLIPDKETQLEYTPTYGWVKDANAWVHKLGKYILDYEWNSTKVMLGTEVKDEHNARAFDTVKRFQPEKFNLVKDFSGTADCLVSEFTSDNGYAYMVVNYTEPTAGIKNTVTISFDGASKAKIVTNNGEQIVDLTDGIVSISLGSGEGAFIIPKNS